MTWNTRPGTGPIVAGTLMTGGTETLSFDLTGQVVAWLGDPAANFGIELSQRDAVQTDMPSMFTPNDLFAVGLFASSANTDAAIRPALRIAAVPLPASALLLLGGAGALAGLGRMRRRG